jgi:hypothetical protein
MSQRNAPNKRCTNQEDEAVNKKFLSTAMLLPFAAATMVATAPTASAGVPFTEKSGRCSKGSVWKIKAKPDNGRMEVEFQVDSNRNRQRWNVRLTDNRQLVFAGAKVTVAPSGSFSVERLTANRRGVDHFVGVATNPRTREVCVARVNR